MTSTALIPYKELDRYDVIYAFENPFEKLWRKSGLGEYLKILDNQPEYFKGELLDFYIEYLLYVSYKDSYTSKENGIWKYALLTRWTTQCQMPIPLAKELMEDVFNMMESKWKYEINGKVKVYATNWNCLRVISGMQGLHYY